MARLAVKNQASTPEFQERFRNQASIEPSWTRGSGFEGWDLRFLRILVVGVWSFLAVVSLAAEQATSQWVHYNSGGKLVYKTSPGGDRIMDFSSAGYMGGGVAIPTLPVRATVSPSGGDDTSAIQDAVDSVSRLPLAGGIRGAVLLKPGVYNCRNVLSLKTSGVVLRGSGAENTTLHMMGPPHVCISVSGLSSVQEVGKRVRMTDWYVPSGASSFQVENVSVFKFGDQIRVIRPVTGTWVKFMGMDRLVRDGQKETWLSAPGELYAERKIVGIQGNRIELDIPLTDCFDQRYLRPPGGYVVKCERTGGLAQVGIEQLRILSAPQPVEISERHNQAIRLNGVTDGWLRDLLVEDTVNSISIAGGARRVTVENVVFKHTVATKGAAKPMDLSASGAQILFNRCSGNGDNIFYFVTGPRVTGPVVLLNCTFYGNGHIQPHARWATGLLVDNCQVPESGIDFMNRGEMGSGHGWTIGWAVAWNCTAKSYVIQQPPGSANWAIGCKGQRLESGMPFGHEPKLPEGIYDSHGTPIEPESLYLAQLRERLGPQAVRNIGY
jgi:hypothetical protein